MNLLVLIRLRHFFGFNFENSVNPSSTSYENLLNLLFNIFRMELNQQSLECFNQIQLWQLLCFQNLLLKAETLTLLILFSLPNKRSAVWAKLSMYGNCRFSDKRYLNLRLTIEELVPELGFMKYSS